MKILHTSDWHIGRSLHGRRRYAEFQAFFDWLLETISAQQIDVLLVAGDLFDSSAPSPLAQTLYYQFLHRVASSCCRHVVIVAGNHDSPTLLNAPSALLKNLDIHVIGQACDDLNDEVLLLRDAQGEVELIVCAVPYLRDRDIRQVEAGESLQDKERKLVEGIRQHYAAVTALAEQQRAQLAKPVPLIASGHLFAAGGQTIDGDGVRDLYVGSLAQVGADMFPAALDYVALGHLHVPQKVQGSERVRYSGSPLAMGFGEAKQQKQLCLVEFQEQQPKITTLAVPVFQVLQRVQGDWDSIEQQLKALIAADSDAWLEVSYQGKTIVSDLRLRLEDLLKGSRLELLRIQNKIFSERALLPAQVQESLADLDTEQVFERCLNAHEIQDPDERAELSRAYREILEQVNN